MKRVRNTLTVTMCASAHVDIESDAVRDIITSDITNIIPVDPELGIGRAIVFLIDGSSLNVLETDEDLLQISSTFTKTIIRNNKVRETNLDELHD